MDVVADATTRLIVDITSFNKYYSTDLRLKTETYDKVFVKVEEFLSNMKEML